MGGRGSSGGKSIGEATRENSYEKAIDNLQTPKESVFSDSKISPLAYDGSKLMEVNFGDWRTPENDKGIHEVNISDIVTTQPNVQSGKLKNFKGNIDTSDVALLKIDEKYYVPDGNHRIVASLLKGQKKIRVRVYERK